MFAIKMKARQMIACARGQRARRSVLSAPPRTITISMRLLGAL
jgi:hypothetical protein